jgi:FkbM family methyltransferase
LYAKTELSPKRTDFRDQCHPASIQIITTDKGKSLKTLKLYMKKLGWQGVKLYLIKKIKFPRHINVNLPQSKDLLSLRPNTSDMDVFQQVFINEEYEFPLDKAPEVIVDAGSNIGLASIYYSIKYPDAKIIAIEPEDSNFLLLRENIKNYPNIVSTHKALWHTKTRLKISNPLGSKFSFRVETADDSQEVISLTMEELMDEYGLSFIDILKMDIEGAEKEVFSQSLKWLSKVGMIAIELHDKIKTGYNRSFYSAIDPFVEKEYRNGENVFIVTNNVKKT